MESYYHFYRHVPAVQVLVVPTTPEQLVVAALPLRPPPVLLAAAPLPCPPPTVTFVWGTRGSTRRPWCPKNLSAVRSAVAQVNTSLIFHLMILFGPIYSCWQIDSHRMLLDLAGSISLILFLYRLL